MTDSNNEEVKEFVQVVPASTSNEEVDDTTEETEIETPEESSTQETKTDESEESEEAEPEEADAPEETEDEAVAEEVVEPKPVEGETPRERAMRLEMTRVKALLRKERSDELFIKQKDDKTVIDDEELKDYDPEELKRFEKLALKMGFAKKDEIIGQSIQERNSSEFDSFMEEHPEYSPENDKEGLLWNNFKETFQLYVPPKDPKTLRKVLTQVHNQVYGIQSPAKLTKINASREKIKVASHNGGASAGKTVSKSVSKAPDGIRKDALRGFSETEIDELFS